MEYSGRFCTAIGLFCLGAHCTPQNPSNSICSFTCIPWFCHDTKLLFLFFSIFSGSNRLSTSRSNPFGFYHSWRRKHKPCGSIFNWCNSIPSRHGRCRLVTVLSIKLLLSIRCVYKSSHLWFMLQCSLDGQTTPQAWWIGNCWDLFQMRNHRQYLKCLTSRKAHLLVLDVKTLLHFMWVSSHLQGVVDKRNFRSGLCNCCFSAFCLTHYLTDDWFICIYLFVF